MLTLSLTETGQTRGGELRPWPWALNHAGRGYWFETADEMIGFAEQLITSGQTNFDIGCFQLNYRWHGEQFTSLTEMAEPARNADYAASFLRTKFNAVQSWRTAVGAYHSQTPATAEAYLARFETVFAQWADGPVDPAPEALRHASTAIPTPDNVNRYPLLLSGQAGSGPSLVPLQNNGIGGLIGVRE
jgi:hypothetical protein